MLKLGYFCSFSTSLVKVFLLINPPVGLAGELIIIKLVFSFINSINSSGSNEKPLFSNLENFHEPLRSQVCVAYNLRFHPLLQRLCSEIEEQSVLSVQVYVGQYIPDWRPEQNNQQNYSLSSALGGGALRDLSHELDYVQWLVGALDLKYVFNEKISDLEIETDDILLLYGENALYLPREIHLVLNFVLVVSLIIHKFSRK